jgi:hypothetical protein
MSHHMQQLLQSPQGHCDNGEHNPRVMLTIITSLYESQAQSHEKHSIQLMNNVQLSP